MRQTRSAGLCFLTEWLFCLQVMGGRAAQAITREVPHRLAPPRRVLHGMLQRFVRCIACMRARASGPACTIANALHRISTRVARVQVVEQMMRRHGAGGSDTTRDAARAAATAALPHGTVAPVLAPLAAAPSEAPSGSAEVPRPPFAPATFDLVLCDAPCTAMGQKPLVHWPTTLEEVCARKRVSPTAW